LDIRRLIVKAVVSKWGNSLAVRIPRAIAGELGLRDGTAIEVKNDNGRVVLERSNRPSLKKLLSGITVENRHESVEFGSRKGREIW
jgi:antitoxin MazE